MLIGISGCAFLKASAAGTRGASTQTVILPPESVWPPVLPPPPPEHADRASPTTANAATVVVTDNNFLVFIDTPCDVVALANTPSCTYHCANRAEVHLVLRAESERVRACAVRGNFDLVRSYYRSDESQQETSPDDRARVPRGVPTAFGPGFECLNISGRRPNMGPRPE